MSAPKISLIISTYQSPAALDKVLQGVERQTVRPDEILIADDGSGEPTRELIKTWQSRLALRHVWHEDRGFRKTIVLNQAVAAATGDYLVLLDGDCVPHHQFIRDHAALAEKNFWVQGRRCFVQEKFVPEFSPERASIGAWCMTGRITGVAKAFRLPFPVVRRNREHRGIIGCNMALWREDLVAVNGFDEDYTGWGIGEDSDLGARLYHLGRTRKFVYGWAVVYHLNHPQLSKAHVPASLENLARTIASGKTRCQRGLQQYLEAHET
ncbi:MAG TPA: glycosyltransferase family 2 protein [Verrucomicrobiae bacterium]|nr:glycosyltransferase family 2 protein [Verrucomicrobiae bacterium]